MAKTSTVRRNASRKSSGSGSGGSGNPPQIQPVNLPVPEPNPYNIQAVKEYVFNETGNIMVASTAIASDNISQQTRDIFAEVSVFFAAMTRAMSNTINPHTNKPYSIYDYAALEGIIDGSGLFVHVTEEDVTHEMTSWGVSVSTELIEAVLGLATGEGELAFAQALISSIGQRGLDVGGSSDTSDGRVGTIVFVCEYLMGMPVVSAVVVYIDAKEHFQELKIGPCIKEHSSTLTLKMHKDTYMFVTPNFIRTYSGDLLSVESDLQYLELVDYLQDLVEQRPIVTAVQTADGQPAPEQLETGKTYYILGAFLTDGQASPTLRFIGVPSGTTAPAITASNPQSNVIAFSIASGTMADAYPIGVFDSSSGTNPRASTPMAFSVTGSSS